MIDVFELFDADEKTFSVTVNGDKKHDGPVKISVFDGCEYRFVNITPSLYLDDVKELQEQASRES
jgi:hypothetical protein